ncbi:MAG: hypothetical protein PHW02_06975 [bacterium]|nr:hypothetical protein [bacterium]
MANKLFISTVLSLMCAFAQAYTLSSEKTVILGDTVYMSSEVILLTDDFKVETDTALFLRNDSIVVMPRPLFVTRDDSTTISAKSGDYMMKGKIFKLSSQKTEKKGSFFIESDSLKILLIESLFVYTITPVLYFDSASGAVSGDTIKYSFAHDSMRIFNQSVFKKSGGYEIISDTIMIMPDDSVYSFYHSCRVITDSMRLETDSMVYYAKDDYAKTFYRTVILSDNISLQADTVRMLFKNDSLDFMTVYRNVDFKSNDSNEKISIICDSLESDIEKNKMKKTYFYLIKKSEMITGEENGAEE